MNIIQLKRNYEIFVSLRNENVEIILQETTIRKMINKTISKLIG